MEAWQITVKSINFDFSPGETNPNGVNALKNEVFAHHKQTEEND